MEEKNHELKEIIRRSGVPIKLLASWVFVTEKSMREILEEDLSESDVNTLLWRLYYAENEMKSKNMKPRKNVGI